MKAETLETLILDRHFGELTPEAEELLLAYLAQNPKIAEEARKMTEAFEVTAAAVERHPELFRQEHLEEPPVPPVKLAAMRDALDSPWLRAAAVLMLSLSFAFFGFRLGSKRGAVEVTEHQPRAAEIHRSGPAAPLLSSASGALPWARYRIETSSAGTESPLRVDYPLSPVPGNPTNP